MIRSERLPVITVRRGRTILSIQPSHLRPPCAIWVSPLRSIWRLASPSGIQGCSRPITIWAERAIMGRDTTWGTP